MLALCLLTLVYSAAQITDIRISPNPMLVGEQAQIECRVSEPDKVVKVSLVILNGLMKMDMTHQGDGVYQLLQDLPVDAPTGKFPISIDAELKDGKRVEHKFSFTITEADAPSLGTLKPTFTLDESAEAPIPRQNGIIFPSLERQSSRPTIELSGQWYSKRFPDADHELSFTERTPETLESLEAEMPSLFEPSGFHPAEMGWRLTRVPAPDNPPPDRSWFIRWVGRELCAKPLLPRFSWLQMISHLSPVMLCWWMAV